MEATEEQWKLVRETVGEDRLSVVMPVYSLADAIAANLESTAQLFESHGVRAELVPVDDGSPDATGERILAFAREAKYACVTVKPVVCPRNGGKGSALRAGFEASSGGLVMLLDGDLDINPKQTPFFFSAMSAGNADIVVGSKRHPQSSVQYPWHRRIVSWTYFTLVKFAIGLPITDTQTGMKLFRRKVLGEALDRMLVKTYAFDLELLAIARERGAKIAEAPVVISFGSKFGALKPRTVWAMAKDSLAVFYRLRFLKYYARAEVPPKLAAPPLVTVVVACPGDSAMLRECLAGVAAQTWERVETVVLPDAPLDAPAPGVRVIPTGKVRPAEKRNAGIAAANGEIVAFIDDDAHPDRRWLEYAVKYFGDERTGAVGGPGATPPDDPYLAKAGGRVYENILVSGNYRYRYRAGGVRRDVDDYPSCNLLVRTSLLRKIGGYRTDFWPGEDTLLCKDVIDAGFRIVYDPWVIVYHHRRALFAPHLRQLGRYAFHRGYFVKRFPSNSLHLSYFVPSAFTAYVAVLAAAAAVAAACGAAGSAALRVFAIPAAVYAALVAATTFSFNPATWLLTAAGVVLTHIWYGVQFVRGLCASRAPCEFIGKDRAK